MVKVSVIVPVYNVVPYLPAALDCVLAQSLEEWECILVDDGSTDRSGAVCDEYAARDARFKVIHQRNAGAGPARNAGMDAASGEYLFFMDPDDLMHPRWFSRLVAVADRDQADVVIAPVARYHIEERRPDILYSDRRRFGSVFPFRRFSGRSVAGRRFIEYFGVTVWDKLFRRSFVVGSRIRFQPVRKHNDMCFAMECGFRAGRISTVRFPGYVYFVGRKGSLQNSGIADEHIWQVAAECERRVGGLYGGVWEPYVEEYFSDWKTGVSARPKTDGGESSAAAVGSVADLETIWSVVRSKDSARTCPFARAKGEGMKLKFRIFRYFARNRYVAAYYFRRERRKMRTAGSVSLCTRKYMIDNAGKAVFLEICGVASSSVRQSMLRSEAGGTRGLDWIRHRRVLADEARGYHVFSFVRNPYSRLVAVYENKIRGAVERPGFRWFDRYLSGFLSVDRGFDDFVRKVCSIPEEMLNEHLCPQYEILHDKDGRPLADFVGRMEDLPSDYEKIRERFGYAPIEHYNRCPAAEGEGWRGYYSEDLADLVYAKYRKDFDAFGYGRF